MVAAIVDTTIIVDLLREYSPAIAWMQVQPALGITPIVWMEVMSGGPNKAKRLEAARLMERFEMIYLARPDLDWAMQAQMQYELSHGVGMMDCLIASVSYRLQIPLYTHNLRHYSPLLGRLAQQVY